MLGFPNYKIEWELVSDANLDGNRFSIESPANQMSAISWSFEFSGFIARKLDSKMTKARYVVLKCGSVTLLRTPIDIPRRDVISSPDRNKMIIPDDVDCGFSILVPLYISARNQILDVYVERDPGGVQDDGERPIIRMTITNMSSVGDLQRHRLSDIGVVSVASVGRSGSTLMCRLLGQHPDCFVPRFLGQFGEMSPVDHYLRAIATLSTEGSPHLTNQFESAEDYLGLRPGCFTPDPTEGESGEIFRGDLLRTVTERAFEVFTGAFQEVAGFAKRSKPSARFWVEKQWVSTVANLGRELVSDWREIFIVRDIQEFWRSQTLFHQKLHLSPTTQEEHRRATFEKYEFLCQAYLDRKDKVLLVHYEKLISDTEDTMKKVLDHVGLPHNSEFVSRCLEIVTSDDFHSRESRTSSASDEVTSSYLERVESMDDEYRTYLNRLLSVIGYHLTDKRA